MNLKIVSGEDKKQKDVHHIQTRWEHDMHFICTVNGQQIHFDKTQQHGGENKGPNPKPVLLSAISGCCGMEILSILNKMRISIESLGIEISGELSDATPQIYKVISIVCSISASANDSYRIVRAVNMAVLKYCSLVAMVRYFAEVKLEVKIVQSNETAV